MAIATVTSKGQVTVPIEFRKRLHVGAGDRIEFFNQADGTVALRALTGSIRDLKGIVPKRARPVPIEEMDRAIAQATAKRDKASRR